MDAASPLRLGLDLAHWSTHDLWLAAFGLGGNLSPKDIDGIVHGDRLPSAHDYNLMAHALNEHLRFDLHFDFDLHQPISGRDQIDPV